MKGNYQMVTARSVAELERRVSTLRQDGWTTDGVMTIDEKRRQGSARGLSRKVYHQAMIRPVNK